jgi:hypothetical protein
MSSNPGQHQRTKHIEIDIFFVPEKAALGQVCILRVPSDIVTKGLATTLFTDIHCSLNVVEPTVDTAGGARFILHYKFQSIRVCL